MVHFCDKYFKETLRRFMLIIEIDKEMDDSIPENQRKKIEASGKFSHATKQLIKKYVSLNWEAYLAKKGVKNETEDIDIRE